MLVMCLVYLTLHSVPYVVILSGKVLSAALVLPFYGLFFNKLLEARQLCWLLWTWQRWFAIVW